MQALWWFIEYAFWNDYLRWQNMNLMKLQFTIAITTTLLPRFKHINSKAVLFIQKQFKG